MPVVIVLTGPNNGDYHPIGDSPLVVGRGDQCSFQISDPKVSRTHLQFRFDQGSGEYTVANLSTTQGVVVNSKTIVAETTLSDGDVIQIGSTLLLYAVKEFTDVNSAMNYYRVPGVGIQRTILD